ncbi:nuclease [Alicyclobacillus acidoterrestris]|nr:nuclease [Alicyclobacillus acidoterrestris]
MRESSLERRLVREVERIGGKAPKWVSPGNRGVPDRIVILPEGQTVYVEMKAPGKQLDPLQVRWAKILKRMGHRVYKIDSDEGIDQFIAEVTSSYGV